MKRLRKFFTLLLAAPLFLSSCIMNNGLCYEHVDKNSDGICDVCGQKIPSKGGSTSSGGDIPGNPCTEHKDHDLDGKCDICGANMSSPAHDHVDGDQNGFCDICGATMIVCDGHVDNNGDGKCDKCGANMPPVSGDVTVYLVLSSVGLYNGAKGTTYSEMNVEYAVKFIQPAGSDLPGANEVTHLYGNADFSAWVAYEGAGAPTVYTKVPTKNNKILYAQFVYNGKDPVVPTPDDPSTPEDTRNIILQTKFGEYNWSLEGAKIYAYCWGGESGDRVYQGTPTDESRNAFSFAIGVNWTSIIFARVNPNGTFTKQDWSSVWNQTEDLAIDATKSNAKITSWSDGKDGKSTVVWAS